MGRKKLEKVGEGTVKKIVVMLLCALLSVVPANAREMSARERTENAVPFAELSWCGGMPVLGGLPDSLPQWKINELATLSEISVKDAGKRIGALRLSFAALEDTYLRILIAQYKLSPDRALELWEALHGVDGFRTTMRKISSSNPAQHKGHLFELELAEAARRAGMTPAAVGKKFDDGRKGAQTDLDVWLKDGTENIFIEAKNYEDVTFSVLPHFRADMDSLNTLPDGLRVFAMRRAPERPNVARALELEAQRRGVLLLRGSPAEVVRQIREAVKARR